MTALAVLSPDERASLDAHEAVVREGLGTFYAVGEALAAIRDQRLYREQYRAFEDYCRQRWGMSRMHASRLIAASDVVASVTDRLQNTISPPANIEQTRPLARLTPDERREVWPRVIESAPGGRVTASHVAAIVRDFKGDTHVPLEPEDAPTALIADLSDGPARDHAAEAQWHAITVCLYRAAREGAELIRHWEPGAVARLLPPGDDRGLAALAPLLDFVAGVIAARREESNAIRRVK